MPILLSFFYFFYFGIIGVYIIFLPKVLSMVGYSPSDIGIIFAAGPLVRFLLPFTFTRGIKIDLKLFKFALFIMILNGIALVFSLGNFYKLLSANIGLAIGFSLILPYIEHISLSTIGKERYGRVRLFGSIGFVLVALVLVKFLTSPEIALYYMLTLITLTSVVAFIIAKNIATIDKKVQDVKNDIDLLKDWKLWLGLTLMQVSFGAFYNFFSIYETGFGITLDMTIYLWSFGVLAEIVMLYFQKKLIQGNLLFIIQVTTFVSAIRWFLIFLFPQNLTILFFAQSLHALSFALFHTAAISYLFHLYKHRSLSQQFFSGITYGMGGFVGALYAGYIYELFPRYLFLSATAIALFSSYFIYLWRKEINNRLSD